MRLSFTSVCISARCWTEISSVSVESLQLADQSKNKRELSYYEIGSYSGLTVAVDVVDLVDYIIQPNDVVATLTGEHLCEHTHTDLEKKKLFITKPPNCKVVVIPHLFFFFFYPF